MASSGRLVKIIDRLYFGGILILVYFNCWNELAKNE